MSLLLTDIRTNRRQTSRRESDIRNENYKSVLIVAFVFVSMLMLWIGIEIGERGAAQKQEIIRLNH